MKRMWFLPVLLLLLLPRPARAVCPAEAELIGVRLDGALYENGYTYVPLRGLLAATGDGFSLVWEGETRCAVASVGGHSLVAKIGTGTLFADGRALPCPRPPFILHGATYVPFRLTAEALGLTVFFDAERGTAVAEGTLAPARYAEETRDLLARLIRAESEGECMAGQVAVGNTVLNRVASPAFADTVEDVIREKINGYYQFTPVENGRIARAAGERARTAAEMALAGYRTVSDALYFFDPQYSSGAWITQNCRFIAAIGCHRFYC